jgi:hypothetical protein
VLNERGVDASIVEGRQSQYDVLVDGALVFSKEQQGRFPEDDEILALLEAA